MAVYICFNPLLSPGLSDITEPPVSSVGALPKCQGWNGHGCISLLVLNADFVVSIATHTANTDDFIVQCNSLQTDTYNSFS